MNAARVVALRTYPAPGMPPVDHHAAVVTTAGFEGDRPKKAPVSLVGHDAHGTRANIVLDAPTTELEALDGAVVHIGTVVLLLRRTGNTCRGAYASVCHAGRVAVGDIVVLTAPNT
ncbi:MAG: hypothetical protein ACRCYX_13855 [Dermatophilaceae bacterium]